MAQRLGLDVVAEGVETRAQHDWLVAAGCDHAQDFGHARPMHGGLLGSLLQRGTAWGADGGQA